MACIDGRLVLDADRHLMDMMTRVQEMRAVARTIVRLVDAHEFVVNG